MSEENITFIRDAEPLDSLELASLYHDVRRQTFDWVAPIHFKRDDFYSDTAGEKVLVAVRAGRLVGFVSIWMADGFIHHLYVSREFQGLGIGGRLLNEALRTVSLPARLKCVIRNHRACQFYEKRGWRAESEGLDEITGQYRLYVSRES